MPMLSDDDRNLAELSDEELALAWDLWFDLAQSTNESDPPYCHGVFAGLPPGLGAGGARDGRASASADVTEAEDTPAG